MHRFLLTLTAAATVLATGLLASSPVAASPLSASMGTNLPVEALAPIENVAVCFYANGWNGPGLYECGSYRRHGMVLASEMVVTATSIATAGATNLMGQAFAFKPKGAGATEPPPMPMTRPPLRGGFFLSRALHRQSPG
jgi:hypothetical protein